MRRARVTRSLLTFHYSPMLTSVRELKRILRLFSDFKKRVFRVLSTNWYQKLVSKSTVLSPSNSVHNFICFFHHLSVIICFNCCG